MREAFPRLESEGLLRLYPRRGAMVAEPTERDVAEVLELRELVESFAARRVAELGRDRRDAPVARLRAPVDRRRKAWLRGDAVAVPQVDRAIHATIVHSAGSRPMDDVYTMLRDRQERVAVDNFRRYPDGFPTVLTEHARLADLVERGDVGGYELALRRHLSGTRHVLAGTQAPRGPRTAPDRVTPSRRARSRHLAPSGMMEPCAATSSPSPVPTGSASSPP